MSQPTEDPIVKEALSLAESWQNRANSLLTPRERAIQQKMLQLMTHPTDKVILSKMIDQSFRSRNNRRVADQISFLLNKHGIPHFFSLPEKFLANLFLKVGRWFPDRSVPKMIDRMRKDSSRAIIPGEPQIFHAYLEKRKSEGVRLNINHLGEAVLGEEEAARRLEGYIEALRSPEIEYISVKISTIYSQIHALAFEHSLDVLKKRLTLLYRAARDNEFIRRDGTRVPKFVNLDMEEYRDLAITKEAFIGTLEESEFLNHSAGIVLQAYLPDSYAIQKELTAWAKKRVESGGSPIKLRIVKGANMEMEMVESSLNNWPLAPYDSKLEVDANYKRMVEFGMEPENIRAVHLGVASHNLFDLAYASTLAKHGGVGEFFIFEMLEGMADHVRRAIQKMSGDVLLYAPVAGREQFINAIAYLIRRLDENTAEENFLRYIPNLKTKSSRWAFLKEQFLLSLESKDRVETTPHRLQDRIYEDFSRPTGTFHEGEFINEANTDWSLTENRTWAKSVRDKWKKSPGEAPIEIPLVVAGKEIYEKREARECFDPSRANEKILVARFALANEADIEQAVATAKADPDEWRKKSLLERHEILSKTAVELRKARGDLIGAAAANTGKVFSETDVEVSEAVDFAEYYPFSLKNFTELANIESRPRGVGLVISPWNFPVAIPCGGITASLAAGNTVIFKPSSASVLVAWKLCQCFWSAGISRNVLQFLPCSGSTTGTKLTAHPDIDYIILTGGTDTGLSILRQRPGVSLSAETGGKNATIVTAMADRDQAIKNVIYSAFGNSGQKCSATSLLILEREVYEDSSFKRQLVDAARSLDVGSAWEFKNQVGPLIHPPEGDLKNALTRLDPGEEWALEPRNIEGNPYLWTPGIKWNVQPGSYTHKTEFFGPVLAVMCARNLDQAIALANETGYGLTAGLESLDEREQERWKAGLKAGNLYINRGTTGAITLRQPFGGMGKSALGAGIKAGGPDYAAQFMHFKDKGFPSAGAIEKDHALLRLALEWKQKLDRFGARKTDIEKTVRAIKSYLYRFEQDFSKEKDFFHLRGQDNYLKYLPVGRVIIRMHEEDSLFDTLARIAGARIAGSQATLSIPTGLSNDAVRFLHGKEGRKFTKNVEVIEQTDREIIEMMPRIQRIRYAAENRVSPDIFRAAAKRGLYIARSAVSMEGRIELLHYFQQQSICNTYHRYGNLGERALI